MKLNSKHGPFRKMLGPVLTIRVPSVLFLLLVLAAATHVVFYVHISRMEDIQQTENEVQMERALRELVPTAGSSQKTVSVGNTIGTSDSTSTSTSRTAINGTNGTNGTNGKGDRNKRCGKKVLTPHFLQAKDINKYTNTKIEDYTVARGFKVFVNRNEKTFKRRKLYPSCSFTPLNESGPVPVLFLINGRSGSSNTWLTLTKLAGGNAKGANEVFGSDVDQIGTFFKSMQTEEEGSWWLREHLCEVTKIHCHSSISGIQWKPYADSLTSNAGRGILKEIARHNAEVKSMEMDSSSESQSRRIPPRIRVLYMTRNPIDVEISRVKHKSSVSKMDDHCISGDEECIKRHKTTKKLMLPADDLVAKLQEDADQVELIVNTLETTGVEYYRTSYEKLYNSNSAEEWMNIFRYLGRGPVEGLTLDEVNNSFPLAKTTHTSRKDRLSNYDEVKEALAKSDFLYLLDD